MADPIEEEIQQEVKAHKILIYGKGTKTMPMCGFTRETMQFFDKYGYPYELIDVLSQPAKREALTKITNWPTLPRCLSTAPSMEIPISSTRWPPRARSNRC